MVTRIKTCALSGIESHEIDAEVTTASGEYSFIIIGLGDNAVKEARDRVATAIKQSGFQMPDRTLVNLAPAGLKKEGSCFDLAIAVGILSASGQIRFRDLHRRSFCGELSLDGRVKPVRGIIAMVIGALQSGIQEVIVPLPNFREASLISGIRIVPVKTLAQLAAYLQGEKLTVEMPDDRPPCADKEQRLISDVWGQECAKRALLIAAAGGHNLLMIGPPGCGKSMLANRFPSLLPPLRRAERLDSVKIHSIAGLPVEDLLDGERPFRSPHHAVSDAGLTGGGSIPRPGEISLAHNGVLFLDEFPEYRRSALEALRVPMESGRVTVTRAKGTVTFPARFQLLAAMNPCPCGRLGSPENTCLCSGSSVAGYLKKLSGPILDRIDIHVDLEAVPVSTMLNSRPEDAADNEKLLRQSVLAARDLQYRRSGKTNADLSTHEMKKIVKLTEPACRLLETASEAIGLTARSYQRVIKVALTISDLRSASEGREPQKSGVTVLSEEDLAEALGLRSLERLKSYCRGDFATGLRNSAIQQT